MSLFFADFLLILQTIIFNSFTHFGDQRKLIHYNHIQSNNHRLYAMLFNDFLLFTRIKRPWITKIRQILHRTISNHRRQIPKPSIEQSTMDWFDAPEGNHIDLIVYKQVDLSWRKLRQTKFLFSRSCYMKFAICEWMKMIREVFNSIIVDIR